MRKYHLFFLSLLVIFAGVVGLTTFVSAASSNEKVEVINNKYKTKRRRESSGDGSFELYYL